MTATEVIGASACIGSTSLLTLSQIVPDIPSGWASAPAHVILGFVALGGWYLFYRHSRESAKENFATATITANALKDMAAKFQEATEANRALAHELRRSPCLLQRLSNTREDLSPEIRDVFDRERRKFE
jgi:hypothetical protein